MSIAPNDGIAKQSVSPELLTTKQAAELLGLGERTLWRYSNSGRAPAPIRIGSTVRYRRAELLEWIADGCPAIKRA
ncbi:MAG: DNA-binding protein [Hyphomicrobiaceae bacterium]|nr:MAG: DNA-binding protein [Hyphomicrobiaceae bacterium]